MQLSLKVSAGVKEQFTALAAAHGLAFGELLERSLEGLRAGGQAVVTGKGLLRNAGESASVVLAKDRPRPVPIAVPAPPHACGRSPASRSCGHRCRRFRVVGASRRQIHVLVFFQVSHGSAPRLDANMGTNS